MKTMRKTRSRRAFTLLELMVALVIGGLVVAAVFTLGGASSRHFQEQQRIGVTQRSVRMAMDRLRRDVARAGYLGVSDNLSPYVRMCPNPAIPRRVRALFYVNDDPTGNTALDGINRLTNGVSADRLRMTGNYTTGEHYLVRAINGGTIYLQTDWLGYRRSFVSPSTGQVNPTDFTNVFMQGRMLHVETPDGAHFVVNIVSATADTAGTQAQIDVNPSVGGDNLCLRGFGRGAIVSPISWIEYYIGSPQAGSNLTPSVTAITGANTILYRRELDMTDATGATAMPGTTRALLEFAVDFNVDFYLDTANVGQPPSLVFNTGADAQTTVQNSPWKVRSVVASIAARTPEQDRRFPWPTNWAGGRPANAPLNRFLVFPGRPGAARVRRLTTEIYVPNLVPR
jgi:prepilin-type N-terminal cleavage/methylation domain-containing protein